MPATFRMTLAQLNPTVGDFAGNSAKAKAAWEAGKAAGADMVMLPEMFITGYQVQDLVMKPAFTLDAMAHLDALGAECADGPVLAIGGPFIEGVALHNAYYIYDGGTRKAMMCKHELPNETVFDEVRLYEKGDISGPYAVGPIRIGSPICADAWHEAVSEAMAAR